MRVVIVGGVAGGMSCAARARRLDEDAQIIVLEQGNYVSYANCGLPYFVGGEITDEKDLLVQTPPSLKAALNLDVRVGHRVTAIDPLLKTVTVRHEGRESRITYDALVLSPGATAIEPPIVGLDSSRVHTLRTVEDAVAIRQLIDQHAIPGQAVVIGAGFIGLEVAEALAAQGWSVNLVEASSQVLPPIEAELASVLTNELVALGVQVHTGVGAQRLEGARDLDQVVLSDGTMLPSELTVLSVGVRPDTAVFEQAGIDCENGAMVVDQHGRTSLPNIWAVGDATQSVDAVTGIRRPVALAGPANRAGRLVADNIFDPQNSRPIPDPVGTAIVRLGSLTAALTGANRAALVEAHREFHTIHLHPNDHAGYFPGATAIHLIVHFGLDGMLLGAQAVGQGGVDKRIDVLATALRAGMHVDQLIDLDLAYSPPYGMAKDPLNLAGMMGQNLLSGELKLWYADQLEEALQTALVIDVRSAAEFATGHLPGAINIAHTAIRENLQQIQDLAHGRPVRLICKSGMRSYLAYRVLAQQGFDVATFSGGMMTLEATPIYRPQETS